MAEGPRFPAAAGACPSGDAGRPYRSIRESPWQGSCLAWESQGPVCSADAAEGLVPTRGRLAGPGSAAWMGKGDPEAISGSTDSRTQTLEHFLASQR